MNHSLPRIVLTVCCIVFALICLSFASPSAYSQSTNVLVNRDLDFGAMGRNPFGEYRIPTALHALPNNKILVAIRDSLSGGPFSGVARLLSTGEIDTTFGNAGITALPITTDAYGTALAVATDSKILVGGYLGSNFAVTRLSEAGALDSSFGANGTAVFSGKAGVRNGVRHIIVQPDSKILVLGTSTDTITSARYGFTIARLLPDGTLDSSFGSNGLLTGTTRIYYGFELLPDGKIVAVGTGFGSVGNPPDITITRFTTDGMIDTTFGTAGDIFIDLSDDDEAVAITLTSNGKMVVGGALGNPERSVVLRLELDGTLDPTFGDNGVVFLDQYLSTLGFIRNIFEVIVSEDQRILVATRPGMLVRLLPDGSVDESIGNEGVNAIANYAGITIAYAIDSTPGGDYLVAGQPEPENPGSTSLVKVRQDGYIDTTLAERGKVDTTIAVYHPFIGAKILPLPQGGYSTFSSALNYARIAHFTADGLFEPSFGASGIAGLDLSNRLPVASTTTEASDMTIDSAARTIISGRLDRSRYGFITRLTADGTYDTSFGSSSGTAVLTATDKVSIEQVATLANDQYLAAIRWNLPPDTTSFSTISLSRYTTDGVVDSTYGTGGYSTVFNCPPVYYRVGYMVPSVKLILDGEGRAIMGAECKRDGVNGALFTRVNADGTADTSFGTDGVLWTSKIAIIHDLILLPNGKFVVAGNLDQQNQQEFVLIQLNADGSLDTGFGLDGQAKLDFPEPAFNVITRSVRTLSNGALLVLGEVDADIPNTPFDTANTYAFKLSPTGILDITVGQEGYALLEMDTQSHSVKDMLLLSDTAFVTIGGTYDGPLIATNPSSFMNGTITRYMIGEGPTPTATATLVPTATPSATVSPTATSTETPVPTETATPAPTFTATPSATATLLPTATPSPTATVLPTVTSSATATPTMTVTRTPTPMGTASPTISATASSTSVPTNTPTATRTVTPSVTSSVSATPSPQPDATRTPSSTPGATSTPTVTATPNAPPLTKTPVAPSATPTLSVSVTPVKLTPTVTQTATPRQNRLFLPLVQ